MMLNSRLNTRRVFIVCLVILATISWVYFDFFGSTEAKITLNQAFKKIIDKPNLDFLAFVHVPEELLFDTSNLSNYDQKDSRLIKYVLQNHITEPSTLPYPIMKSSKNNIVPKVWPILKQIVEDSDSGLGFFVEAGANDGVTGSNTIWLEQTKNWKGLLVECHPEVLPKLRQKNRKAYIADPCLSKRSHPTKAELQSVDGWLASSSLGEKIQPDFANRLYPELAKAAKGNTKKFEVQTIPLYTLLAAINVTSVDFFSLDIQSLEYVLKNFPFELILVKVWLIEVVLLSPEIKIKLQNLMRENGYSGPTNITRIDELYIHKSIEHKISKL